MTPRIAIDPRVAIPRPIKKLATKLAPVPHSRGRGVTDGGY